MNPNPRPASEYVRVVCRDITSRQLDERTWLRTDEKIEQRRRRANGLHFYVHVREEERRLVQRIDGRIKVQMGDSIIMFRREFQSVAQAMRSYETRLDDPEASEAED